MLDDENLPANIKDRRSQKTLKDVIGPALEEQGKDKRKNENYFDAVENADDKFNVKHLKEERITDEGK